jgi:zinc transport system permease protein
MTEALHGGLAALAREGWLPAPFEHPFMARGLLAALLTGPLLGALGTLVVARRLVFHTQAIGHAAPCGVALGVLLGEPLDAPYAGVYGLCMLVALAMRYVERGGRLPADTVVGIALAQLLGLGVALLVLATREFDIHQLEAVLFGSLLTLRESDLAALALTALAGALALGAGFNRVLLAGVSPVLARARGLDSLWLDYGFALLLAAGVAASVQLIGALLVLVLVALPAAAARNLTDSLAAFFWWSVGLGAAGAVGGLLLSALWPLPTGAAIALVASALFYTTAGLRVLGLRLRAAGGL